jgi:hypothetical protein
LKQKKIKKNMYNKKDEFLERKENL